VKDAVLSIDGNQKYLHLLARRSPSKHAENLPHIIIQIPNYGADVSVNVSRATLLNHSCTHVRAVMVECMTARSMFSTKSSTKSKQSNGGATNRSDRSGYGSNTWVVQIGHAQHKIHISRKSKSSKDITLEVDGDVLIETSPRELPCIGDSWECSFRFFGDRSIYFHLLQTSTAGKVIADPQIIPQKHTFLHTCKVLVQDVSDLASSALQIDGVSFRSLPALDHTSGEPPNHDKSHENRHYA